MARQVSGLRPEVIMNGVFRLVFAAVIAVVSCCICAADEHRYRIGGYDSGSWFNPDQSGHGFKI